jgi:putative thioredoxin
MDVSELDFDTAVVERSRTVPVVVDFWAAWCGPCMQLGPVLERSIAARDGKIELAKVDVDANPNITRAFGVRGIPAVKAFKDGAMVAEFVGAQPKSEIDRFLDALLPSDAEEPAADGDEESLRRAVELEPTRADAAVPLARILHERGEDEAALELLERLPASFAGQGLASRIELERSGQPDLTDAFAALDAGDRARALDLLLEALPSADGARDDIRRVVVGVLDALGVEDPLARESRRRLAAALY